MFEPPANREAVFSFLGAMGSQDERDWRYLTPEQRSYYQDHEKRLRDAMVAAGWGESQTGRLYRIVSGSGKILEE